MADLILEFLVQALFQGLAEVLFELGFKGASAVLRSRVGRYASAAVGGGGVGLWWGARLSQAGRVQQPRMLWVSLAIAAFAAGITLNRWIRHRDGTAGADDERLLGLPWRWPIYRLVGLTVLNLAIAGGVVVGFTPHPPLR